MINMLILAVGMVLLIYGAHWMIAGAEDIAKRFNMSDIFIGFTIIAFGTSAPELIVGIMAALKNAGDITVGNVIGSNIFNLLAVLSITGIIIPIKADIKALRKYIPFSIIVLIILFILGNDAMLDQPNNSLARVDGIILLIVFMFYIYMNIKDKKNNVIHIKSKHNMLIASLLFAGGAAALALGGELTIRSAVEIARMWNVSEKMIAITIVATGTSLPELITSIIAIVRKKPDIAIGNVIGSNIFNILLILGASSLIKPISFNPVMNADILILGIMSIVLLLMVEMNRKKILSRSSSIVLLIAFVMYWVFVIFRK